jgi:hypothetical protein
VIDYGDPAEGLGLHNPAVDAQVAEFVFEVPAAVGPVARIPVARLTDLQERAGVPAAARSGVFQRVAHWLTPVSRSVKPIRILTRRMKFSTFFNSKNNKTG